MMLKPTQQPTCTGLRVRTTRDANVVFHAVAMKLLPMIARRLDATDRAALCSGCVYVWEERGPDADATGVGMERFTEGRHWNPSRIRDDFLLYTERTGPSEPSSPDDSRDPRVPANRRQPLTKQTYSVWVNGTTGLRKWHMNAYYCEDTADDLLTVDEVPMMATLYVPHECYQKARSSRNRDADRPRTIRRASTDDETAPPLAPPVPFRAYTPYAAAPPGPSAHPVHPHPHPHPHLPSLPAPRQATLHDRFSPVPIPSTSHAHTTAPVAGPPVHLVPLDRLQSISQNRRDRLDEELLRSFRMQ